MFLKNILKFTSILTILFLITYLLYPIIKWIINFIDSNSFIVWIILIAIIIYYLCIDNKPSDKITLKKNKLFDDETDKEFNKDKVVGLKNIINSHEGNKFFSLALIGDWGSGKSSFLRKLEDKINDEKKDVVIYLNVWELENIQNILQEIEKEFDNIIFKHDKIEWSIYHLKSILIKNYFSLLSKYFVENSININLPFSNTIKDSKDEYNKLLKRVLQDKKIVLILDELDRLESKADVLDIFKIIRYLASFDKVFTITGLDINKLNGIGIELDYTHKIFNSKYVIPKTTRSELLTFLRKKGSEQQSDFIKEEEFNEILNTNIGSIDLCLIDFITNYREAKSILNDTYIFCNSLNDNSKFKDNWNKFIDFEFILVLNILKSVNLELYLKFMNENERMQLLIINSTKPTKITEQLAKYKNIEEERTLSENEQKKVDDFLKYELTAIINNLKSKMKNLSQNLYVYSHQNIYDFMFTEVDYQNYLNNPNLIEDKLIYLESISKSFEDKNQFIIFLIERIYIEKNQGNREKLFKGIFQNISKIQFRIVFENFLKEIYDINITKELLDFAKEKLDPKENYYFSHLIGKLVNIDKNGDLIKTIYNFSQNEIEKDYLKNAFLKNGHFIINVDESFLEIIKKVFNYFGEKYETFFEDKKEYSITSLIKDTGHVKQYTTVETGGIEIKNHINNKTNLKKEIMEFYKKEKKVPNQIELNDKENNE
ncbi:P-loop NTPase fold protein [Aliarcobacter butzleri]|uniref:P-loop NTPase fold protein n=1 Tax=Aliarcobacter butzleri TaxID=28197 RepID=UPI001EDA0684|nr:P-loop NTPase fold protein [Aliarcobacter butzleri]MCG3657960.1 KAP family NTPase [Aliarcobacter butzleri]